MPRGRIPACVVGLHSRQLAVAAELRVHPFTRAGGPPIRKDILVAKMSDRDAQGIADAAEWAASEDKVRAAAELFPLLAAQEKAAQLAKERAATEPEKPATNWTFEAGTVLFRGHRYPLKAKPLEVLKLFIDGKRQVVSRREVEGLWEADVVAGDAARSVVKRLRKVLREIADDHGIQLGEAGNPIPHRHGAWEFKMPR